MTFLKTLSLLTLTAIAVVFGTQRAGADDVTSPTSDKVVKMDTVTVSSSRFDLNPDSKIDYVSEKEKVIVTYLGNNVSNGDIMSVMSVQELKDNWYPTYKTLKDFTDASNHKDWTLIATREIPDFYIAIYATEHGNIAGVYYARTLSARRATAKEQIKLFVSDKNGNQIVPDSEVYSIVQQYKFFARTDNEGAAGLIPVTEDNTDNISISPPGGSGSFVSLGTKGSVFAHMGRYFIMPPHIKSFHFVFQNGDDVHTHVEMVINKNA